MRNPVRSASALRPKRRRTTGPIAGGNAVLLAAVAAAAAAVALAGCGTHDGPPESAAVALTMNIGECGSPWSAPQGGRVTFAVTNDFRDGMDVELTDARTGGYLLEMEGIGAGATLTSSVLLGDGSYRFICFPNDADEAVGPTVRISDAAGVKNPTPATAPVGNAQLIPATKSYQSWIDSRLPVLKRQVRTLAADVRHVDRAGGRTKAEADWLTAHLTYETLGAAYDAFGAADAAINGSPTSHAAPQIARDRHLAGLHRLEAQLWTGASAAQMAPVADALLAAVSRLETSFPTTNIDPLDMGLRAHEIVENAIQFELNGDTDAGSHTNLATIAANLRGSQQALKWLLPLLRTRYDHLATMQAAETASLRLVESFDHDPTGAGGWTPLSALSRVEREQIDSSLQRTVELLAPVAAILDVRMVPQS